MKKLLFLGIGLIGLLAFRYQDKPTIYIIGDSTVRNNNQAYWGWGTFLGELFDTSRMDIANHAMAGRSTRTFVKEGRWARVDSLLKPGDYLLIQFGHNEGSKPDTTRQGYRGVLPGIGKDSVVLCWGAGQKEVVRTYGENLRRMIQQAKAKGVHPVILSMIPRNQWDEAGKVRRADQGFGLWAKQVAEEQGVAFVDLNRITADKYDQMGAELVKEKYFPGDHTHTNRDGAFENAMSVVAGLREINHILTDYIR